MSSSQTEVCAWLDFIGAQGGASSRRATFGKRVWSVMHLSTMAVLLILEGVE
jgi:hypothetical protein